MTARTGHQSGQTFATVSLGLSAESWMECWRPLEAQEDNTSVLNLGLCLAGAVCPVPGQSLLRGPGAELSRRGCCHMLQ